MYQEHIPACIDKFLKIAKKEKEKNSSKIIAAIKRFAISEHLLNNQISTKI